MTNLHEDEITHHLQESHPNLHSKKLKCFIYGGLDGIITTFAIISSCYGAGMGIKAILILGLSNVMADALSMGLGEFISSDLERDYIKSELIKENYEYENNLEEEKRELSLILTNKDNINIEDSNKIVNIYSKYKNPFLELMLKKELDLELPEDRKDIIIGAKSTFTSFVMFGLIPLIPYLIMFISGKSDTNELLFIISYFCSILSVILLGYMYIKRTKQSIFYLFKFAISATLAAAAAFIIGYSLESLL